MVGLGLNCDSGNYVATPLHGDEAVHGLGLKSWKNKPVQGNCLMPV